jgi:LPXTG-motif cell wall-anchored protein
MNLQKQTKANCLIKIFNKDNEALPGIDIKVNGSEAYLIRQVRARRKILTCLLRKKKHRIKEITTCITFRIKWKEQVKEIDLKSEQVIKHEKPKKKESIISDQKWLWITLIGLVLLLGAFAFSLMKKVNR